MTPVTALSAKRRDELAALVAKNGGSVTPAQVVDFARNPDTALHGLFTWDDGEAAERWRQVEAATFIRAVAKVIPRDDAEPLKVRAYVALSSDRGEDSYRPIETVLSNEAMRAQLIADATKELVAFRRKFSHVQELAMLIQQIDAFVETHALAA